MNLMPNIVIFRLPLAEPGDNFGLDKPQVPSFAQVNIVENKIDAASLKIFTVREESGYNKLTTDRMVFAHFEDGVSTELCSISLAKDDGTPANIWEVGVVELNDMMPELLHQVLHAIEDRQVEQ